MWKLRNSKYIQSNLVGIFQDVKCNLERGRTVCFSGTPCQIEGLQCYLQKEYDNLLLVDVVCHGVASPLIWDKYLETINLDLPNNSGTRNFIIIKKINKTNNKYPRQYNQIIKKTL